MRILLLTNIYATQANPYGASFIQARVQAMRRDGYEVDCVAVGAVPRNKWSTRPVGCEDGTVAATMLGRMNLRFRASNVQLERDTVNLISDKLNMKSYDGIMAHGMFSLAAGRVAKEIADNWGLPFSIHLHGSDVNVVMARNAKGASAVLGSANATVFVSKALLRTAQRLGFEGKNHHVIPNGVDVDVFRPDCGSHPGMAQGSPRLCFVGNLLAIKGADRLPEVFQSILRVLPQASLTVVGDGPLRNEISKRMASPNVKFLGRVPISEVAAVMAASDALLLPSRNEGWPTVINECYAVGRPVVGSNVGGVAEALLEGNQAVEDGAGFEERFALAVISALENPSSEDLMRRAKHFTWRAIVSRELGALGMSLHS